VITSKHPGEINPFLQYRQAKAFFKRTSRAKNPAWYQGALELDFQLHIRTDGASVNAFLYDHTEKLWAPGPPLNEKALLDPELMTAYVGEAIKHVKSVGGTSLGVVFHLADEFSLTEIKPEFEDRDALPALREAAVADPASALADSVISDQSSSRILPYPATESPVIATAITVSHRHEPVVSAIRDLGNAEDFPIVTLSLSAPLIALLGIPGSVKRTDGKPFLAILQYPFFTVLASFNENSDLLLVRTQLHRGLRRPPNFRHAIATTTASLELIDPDLFVFPLGEDVDRALAADLSVTFTKNHVETVVISDIGTLAPWCAECIISTREPVEDEQLPGSTFGPFRDEKWSFQDFLPLAAEKQATYPTRNEMRLMKTARIVRLATLPVVAVAALWMFFAIYSIVSTPEWAFDTSETAIIRKKLTGLTAERQQIDHWNNLLEDRSKGWIVMESFSRLFPENSGILSKDFAYSSRPDSSPGQAKVGFVKDWKISGWLKGDEAAELLNTLNSREGISAHFNQIADITGNSAYRTDIGTRSIVVNIKTQENPAYRPNNPANDALIEGPNASTASYPFNFDLAITQRFEATDPLAIPVAKAP
jgi:hypothetical protein